MLMDSITLLDSAAPTVDQSGNTAGGSIYDIAGSTLTIPTNAAILMRFSVNRAFTMAIDMAGSFAESVVAATGSPVYLVKQNGSQVGTISFTGNVGTFGGMPSAVSFAVGDILTVEAPATADSSHDEISWTLAGTLV